MSPALLSEHLFSFRIGLGQEVFRAFIVEILILYGIIKSREWKYAHMSIVYARTYVHGYRHSYLTSEKDGSLKLRENKNKEGNPFFRQVGPRKSATRKDVVKHDLNRMLTESN